MVGGPTVVNATQSKKLIKADCEVRVDTLTRQLYATDASIYQIEPQAVAFPRSPEETKSVIAAAVESDIPVIPRGAGTGLAGGALGRGLVVDFSRHNHGISGLDVEQRRVRVESGVVLDQLNAFLEPHGLRFGPDVATSSRATLGGMIANNSSGSHVRYFGTTIDRVRSLEIALADGRVLTVGREHDSLDELRREIGNLIESQAAAVNEHMPAGLFKRWPGYQLDRWLRDSADLTKVLGGSEGTLACILSAELELAPLPSRKGLGTVCFASVAEAMQATVEILELGPTAIEHIDDVLFDQTRGQLQFRRARALLELDDKPCESILLVEFFDDVDGPLDSLRQKGLGLRTKVFTDDEEMQHIWNLRKAGLSLLTGCKGDAKPTAGIEDACVAPEKLPEYVAGLRGLMDPLGLRGSFYGHAASGLLHVRPVVDLHSAEDIVKFRTLAEQVSSLVKQFKGSIAGEHGVGIARSEFLAEHLGPELMDVNRRIKKLFDPDNRMNPGKIVDGGFKIDDDLRQGAGSRIELPFTPVLAFAAKDGSFVGNLEQCNGCGGCRKAPPTMCPTYAATGEEVMSTRGRANVIRAALEGRMNGRGDLFVEELDDALANCLSCKACTPECPSNVNMALLKAELLHARHARHGVTLGERALSRIDVFGTMASRAPGMVNALLRNGVVKTFLQFGLGLSSRRSMPDYASDRFDAWFAGREERAEAPRGPVILWDDCFVRHNDPQIGRAAVTVLEAAGFEVVLPRSRACCGRPAFSLGRLDLAGDFARANIDLLGSYDPKTPIIFLEPSCYSMFAEDYRELGVDGAEEIARRSFLFEDFIGGLLEERPDALSFRPADRRFAIHGHCHAKALLETDASERVLGHVSGADATVLDTGCCGMAGAFGMQDDRYDLSLEIARPLVEQIDSLPNDTQLVACGTSCRHQIRDLTSKSPLHVAQVLAEALAE